MGWGNEREQKNICVCVYICLQAYEQAAIWEQHRTYIPIPSFFFSSSFPYSSTGSYLPSPFSSLPQKRPVPRVLERGPVFREGEGGRGGRKGK